MYKTVIETNKEKAGNIKHMICTDCNEMYIGQIIRYLITRMT